MLREALAREKDDCQELIRLLLYRPGQTYDVRAEILAKMGYVKRATGWRDTWSRNRHRIAAYIREGREKP